MAGRHHLEPEDDPDRYDQENLAMTSPAPRVLIFGREPAFFAELVASLLVLLNLFFLPGLDDTLQGAINAVVLAGSSVYVAIRVASDNLLPILVGAFKAVIALVVAFGVDLSQPQQAALLTFLSLAAGAFTRTQVDAPVTAAGTVRNAA